MRGLNWQTEQRCVRGVAALAATLLAGVVGWPAFAQEPTSRPAAAAATLREAENVIDLRTFPMLESSQVHHKTRSNVGYVIAKPDLAGDVKFYRDQLTAAGWKIEKEDVNAEQQYGILSASKSGFHVSVSVVKDPNNGNMGAFVENLGNVDVRALPHMAGARPEPSSFNVFYYKTDAKVDAVAEFVAAEWPKLGWRKVGQYQGGNDEPGVHRYVQFVQNGMRLAANINRREEVTDVLVHASLMSLAPPIMPQASGIELMEPPPFLSLTYATKAAPVEVLAFYRKELPALGWAMAAEEEKGADGQIKVKLTGPDKEALRLEVLGKEGVTLVLMAGEGM